jgi:hypothetical protein
MRLPGHREPRPDRAGPDTLDDALEPALNAFDLAFDGRLTAAGR